MPAPAVVPPPDGVSAIYGVAALQPAPLPQTPPVFPLAPEPEASRISGTRGLLIGFLAGAVLMALVALAYFVVVK